MQLISSQPDYHSFYNNEVDIYSLFLLFFMI